SEGRRRQARHQLARSVQARAARGKIHRLFVARRLGHLLRDAHRAARHCRRGQSQAQGYGSAVGELLAAGEADIGIQQIPELAAAPGVDVVGPFPGELQVITVFSAALDTKAKDNAAAKAFVKFISAPAAAAAYKAKGLDPT